MSNHTGYRSIDATPLANIAPGEAVTFDGNGATGRNRGVGTLGFYGADLGSDRPTDGRVPAFLGLAERTGGVYIENTDGGLAVADALAQTGLDFEVRHAPLFAEPQDYVLDGDTLVEVPTGTRAPLDGLAATVAYPRDGGSPFALGVTSKRYTIVQTPDALAVGDAIADGRLVAVGAYGKPRGSKVYAAYELGDGFTIAGDPYRSFVTITTTHDGSGSLSALMAPIRLGCTNQTTATFGRRATPRYNLRHVGDPKVRVDEARNILGLARQYEAALVEAAEGLLAAPMSRDNFVVYAREVFGTADREHMSKRSLALAEVRDEELLTILASQTCAFGEGTAYQGWQAIVEHLDFFGTVRGDNGTGTRRYERVITGELDAAKNRAYALAAEYAASAV